MECCSKLKERFVFFSPLIIQGYQFIPLFFLIIFFFLPFQFFFRFGTCFTDLGDCNEYLIILLFFFFFFFPFSFFFSFAFPLLLLLLLLLPFFTIPVFYIPFLCFLFLTPPNYCKKTAFRNSVGVQFCVFDSEGNRLVFQPHDSYSNI